MTTPPTIQTERALTPGILSGGAARRQSRPPSGPRARSRFITESHALGGTSASPRSMFIAATIAVALYLIGRRIAA